MGRPVRDRLQDDTAFGFLDATVPSEKIFHPSLISNKNDDTMLRALKDELGRSEEFVFSIAFITTNGLALLKQALLDFEGKGTIVTSTYLDFNDPDMFRELLTLERVEVFIHPGLHEGFHPKGYVFEQPGSTTAIIGSSNLTDRALLQNEEWNLRFSAAPEGDIVDQLRDAIDAQIEKSRPLTRDWVSRYEDHYRSISKRSSQTPFDAVPGVFLDDSEGEFYASKITANAMQQEALAAIDEVRSSGEQRAVVISATGTGKTILSALDVQAFKPQRMLFVVHREQILDAAISAYQQVLGGDHEDFGKFVGQTRELEAKYVFATIQSLSRPENLEQISPDHFDYVLIDEVHRAGAESYIRVLDYLNPRFTLGLTATPERTDGFNVFELFDYNVPYEIRLQAALDENMLAPFHYYGVTDYVDVDGTTVDETADLARLVSHERVKHLVQALGKYGHPGPVRGLIFCSRRDEAYELSELLNEETVYGRRLRTTALSGTDSVDERERIVAKLENDQLDYIITVDIFNEGIDIPSVNQIVMMRQTQSSIIFTQQLGRGLRKWQGKDHLRVIDFIGNYTNNYLIPIALLGDSSLNKDVIRKKLIEADQAGTIAGLSSINFDRDAREQVLRSLAVTKLDSMKNLRQAYLQIERRVGSLPRLYDFVRFGTVDPVVIATKVHDYWTFLHKMKRIAAPPPPEMARILRFLSEEVLNGKRPHELLLVRELLEREELSVTDYREVLLRERTRTDDAIIASVERIFSLEFFVRQERKAYGEEPIIIRTNGHYQFAPKVKEFLSHPTFLMHVHDIVDTGLHLARHRYRWSADLLVGEQYSRKDACRLLNWKKNEQSTLYGYKVDNATNTCPIFVTYDKAEDLPETVQYGDELLDHRTMHWFTRWGRRLDSPEIQPIVENTHELHLFVKKDDAEGRDFNYLGTVRSREPVEEHMPAKGSSVVDVVTMKLDLASPLEEGLYRYLTTTREPVELSTAPNERTAGFLGWGN